MLFWRVLLWIADSEGARAVVVIWILDEMGYHSAKFTGGSDPDGTSGCRSAPISTSIGRSVLQDGILQKNRTRLFGPVGIVGINGDHRGGLVANRVGTPEIYELNKESALFKSQINHGVWAGSTDLSVPCIVAEWAVTEVCPILRWSGRATKRVRESIEKSALADFPLQWSLSALTRREMGLTQPQVLLPG